MTRLWVGWGSQSKFQRIFNTPTFKKLNHFSIRSPETPEIYDFDFNEPFEDQIEAMDKYETRCMNIETFKKLDFGNCREKNKVSVDFNTDMSEPTYSFAVYNSLRPADEVSIFPDYSELPSIENLPLDRGGKAFEKKKGN